MDQLQCYSWHIIPLRKRKRVCVCVGSSARQLTGAPPQNLNETETASKKQQAAAFAISEDLVLLLSAHQ